MEKTYKAIEIEVGYHPDGFRIDKTAPPMKLYTRWQVTPDGRWLTPKSVCFHALPEDGWIKVDRFDWGDSAEAAR